MRTLSTPHPAGAVAHSWVLQYTVPAVMRSRWTLRLDLSLSVILSGRHLSDSLRFLDIILIFFCLTSGPRLPLRDRRKITNASLPL